MTRMGEKRNGSRFSLGELKVRKSLEDIDVDGRML